MCILHGYRLFSEEIRNEYAAQIMFFQIQAFPTEKSQILSGFFYFQKSQRCSKKARISKSGFKKAKLATLLRSLKFLTPTSLLLRLNALHSDSETILSFGLRLLLKLQSECYKLLAVSKRPYPVFALKRLKKRIKRNCSAKHVTSSFMSVA